MRNFPRPSAAAVRSFFSIPLVCSCVLLLHPSLVTSANAANASTEASARAAENSGLPPLISTFTKETAGENKGLYSLTLKNNSQRGLKVSGVVELSVVVHNRDKTRTLPAQEIAPGKTTKIDGLAAHDKVTLTVEGFAPLTLTVPWISN